MRITIGYDYQPEDALEAVCGILNSLKVPYEQIDDDTNVHIDYETSEEISKKRESVEIDLDEKELFTLMLMAHEQDITLNQLVNNVLRSQMEKTYENKC